MRKDTERGQMGPLGSTRPSVRHGLTLERIPPVDLEIDDAGARFAKLSRITAEYTVPRLLALHEQAPRKTALLAEPGTADIHQLGKLILGPDPELAAGFFHELRAQGISLDELHSKLLGPTAAHLGDLWDLDRIDFVDVTLGVARLQRLVITFEGLDEVLTGEDRQSIMIVGAPGEQHSLGNSIIQRFFRAAGWQVWNCITPKMDEVARISAEHWFGIIGFSLSLDTHFTALKGAIRRIRVESLNPHVGIIVGGSAIHRNPEWTNDLGADGTAESGPAAVLLANKLLAEAANSGAPALP